MQEQLLVGQAVELAGDGAPPVIVVVVAITMREILLNVAPGATLPEGLTPGVPVTLSFSTTLGFHRARSSLVRISSGKNPVVAVARVDTVTTVQRRQFFRVSATLSTTLLVTGGRVAMVGKEDARALTQDISAGGMRVDTNLALALTDRVKVTLETPRGFRKSLPAQLVCDADVMRVESAVRRNRKVTCVGLRFAFASENDRDRWVQLTFDLQRGVQL